MATLVDVSAPTEQTEGTRLQVLRWLKQVGDPVAAQEPLLELETDKVTLELAAPIAGVLKEILKQPQQEVTAGEPLGRIEAMSAAPAGVILREARLAAPAERPSDQERPDTVQARLSPSVRRLLREHSLDFATVTGTGANGRITATDVLAHLAATPSRSVASAPAKSMQVDSEVTDAPRIRRVPHSLMRRRIAERMVESLLRTAPHVTTVFEADLTAVMAHRAKNRPEFERAGAPLTLTAYFVAACVAAIRAVPETNARWTEDALEISDSIHIGVATALEAKGLIVPVIRDVATLTLLGIARALADLTSRARADRITAEDLRAGTFTISNHGVSGSLVAAPIIINQPQSAILGIGKLEKRVVVLEQDGADVIAIRPRCYVSLTLDHRVMDGHRANQFLSVFVDQLQNWKK